jgi:hypothetical protein
MLGAISIASLHGMDYTNIPKEPFSQSLFTKAIISGSPEAIDHYISEHKKTYLDVLKVCAQQDSDKAVAYALSKIIPSQPVMPDAVFDYVKKERAHYAKWLCHVVPTSTHLEQNYSQCCADTFTVSCIGCITFADIFAWLTAPKATPEVKKMHVAYQKEYDLYTDAEIACNDICNEAYNKKHNNFVQAFNTYKNKKLEHVNHAFME